jgi:hypothetical protein
MMPWRVNDGILLIPLLPLSLSPYLCDSHCTQLSLPLCGCAVASASRSRPSPCMLQCQYGYLYSLSLSLPFLDCAIVTFFTLSVALRASFSATFHRSDKAKLCHSSVCEPVFRDYCGCSVTASSEGHFPRAVTEQYSIFSLFSEENNIRAALITRQ